MCVSQKSKTFEKERAQQPMTSVILAAQECFESHNHGGYTMDYYLDIMGVYSDSTHHEPMFPDYDPLPCIGNSHVFSQVQSALLPLYVGSIKEMEESCKSTDPRANHFI
ncbi:hypothetical protein [Anaplasma platys]|nr:hypothetical protein [Anaplasma platys]